MQADIFRDHSTESSHVKLTGLRTALLSALQDLRVNLRVVTEGSLV